MKRLLTHVLVAFLPACGFAQVVISTSTSLPLDLTGANSSGCPASFSGPSISFTVPAAANGMPLTEIEIIFEDNAPSSMSMSTIEAYLVDNNNNCYHFLNTSTSTFTNTLDYIDAIFVSADHSGCLNEPNTANLGSGDNSDPTVSSNHGIWASAVNFPTHTTVSGTWTIYFKEGTLNEPLITGANLEFGGAQTAVDETGKGDDCIDPIVWDGEPICTTTAGATTDNNTPGNALTGLGNTYDFVNGGNCPWMSTLENDIWVEFSVDVSGTTCISLSGLDGSTQSIIVSDADDDGDGNPCTGSGFTSSDPDPNWVVESCPDPDIYTSNGTSTHQQHCFDAVAGETYYLVIDGTGGAETPFYITGTNGTFSDPDNPLPVELVDFSGYSHEGSNLLMWTTASEFNNDYFEIQRSMDGETFEVIDKVKGNGNTTQFSYYSYRDENPIRLAYYRLRQVDFNGEADYSPTIAVQNTSGLEFAVFPQPAGAVMNVAFDNKNIETSYSISDISGAVMMNGLLTRNQSVHQIQIADLENGVYFIQLNNENGSNQMRFIKR